MRFTMMPFTFNQGPLILPVSSVSQLCSIQTASAHLVSFLRHVLALVSKMPSFTGLALAVEKRHGRPEVSGPSVHQHATCAMDLEMLLALPRLRPSRIARRGRRFVDRSGVSCWCSEEQNVKNPRFAPFLAPEVFFFTPLVYMRYLCLFIPLEFVSNSSFHL